MKTLLLLLVYLLLACLLPLSHSGISHMDIASAAAVASSRSDALDMSMPVKSATWGFPPVENDDIKKKPKSEKSKPK